MQSVDFMWSPQSLSDEWAIYAAYLAGAVVVVLLVGLAYGNGRRTTVLGGRWTTGRHVTEGSSVISFNQRLTTLPPPPELSTLLRRTLT